MSRRNLMILFYLLIILASVAFIVMWNNKADAGPYFVPDEIQPWQETIYEVRCTNPVNLEQFDFTVVRNKDHDNYAKINKGGTTEISIENTTYSFSPAWICNITETMKYNHD